MSERNSDMRGTITQAGDIMQAQNVLVEEVNTPDSRTGYILISYLVTEENNMHFTELLQLNVGWDTILTNQFNEPISLCRIIKGMRIDAWFSASMTRSIPPQSNAYRIVAFLPAPSIRTLTDRVAYTDPASGFLYTGNPNNIADQIRFVISNRTQLIDQSGNAISLDSFQPGQLVRVEYGDFQTDSIPPQTPAFLVQVLTF